MIAGAPGVGGGGVTEAQFGEIQFIHERVDYADRVILADVIVDAFRQKKALASVQAFNIARHVSQLSALSRKTDNARPFMS